MNAANCDPDQNADRSLSNNIVTYSRETDHLWKMNKRLMLGKREGRLNDDFWVLTAAERSAGVDQSLSFRSVIAKVCFWPKLPMERFEADRQEGAP